jgi:hypothetical protein
MSGGRLQEPWSCAVLLCLVLRMAAMHLGVQHCVLLRELVTFAALYAVS